MRERERKKRKEGERRSEWGSRECDIRERDRGSEDRKRVKREREGRGER